MFCCEFVEVRHVGVVVPGVCHDVTTMLVRKEQYSTVLGILIGLDSCYLLKTGSHVDTPLRLQCLRN